MRADERARIAALGVALALGGCGYSDGGVASFTVARDGAGGLHLLATTSPSSFYVVEGPETSVTRYATRDGGAWRFETLPFSLDVAHELFPTVDGRVYVASPAWPPLARVGGRWVPLEDAPRTRDTDLIDGDLAWTGSDGRFRVNVGAALVEYDGTTRVASRSLDYDCGPSAYPLSIACQFVPSGDLSGDVARITRDPRVVVRVERLTLSCDASTCALSEPREDFALAGGADWSRCTLLRTARGAAALACSSDSALRVTTPGRRLADAPLPAHRSVRFAARATQGVLASVRGEYGRLTLLAVDEDGATRAVPIRVVGVQSDEVPVLGGMSGATETADLFLLQTHDTIIHLTVSVETGETLAREAIVVPLDDEG